jgi:DNA-binding IclR family transcriptional regulator
MASDGTEGAARVADVLLRFIDGPQTFGVTAMARELGLSKAVVHRIMRTLVDRDLLEFEDGSRGYRLGPAAAAIGARALRDSQLRKVALAPLRRLRAETGETTTLSARVPDGRVYLDQVESLHEIKMTVELGRRYPLHAGSSSRAILAFLASVEREKVIGGPLPALTPDTLVDPQALSDSLDEVRATGIAQSGGERQLGAASVAAPVFDLDGHPIGAISVCGPRARLTAEIRGEYVPLVTAAADEISVALGWRGGLPDPDGDVRP